MDRLVTRGLRAPGYARYMDDLLVFGDTKDELWATHDAVRAFLCARLDVALKDEVTRLLPITEGVHFLGFVVFPGLVRFDARRVRRWRRRMRTLERALDRAAMDEHDAQRAADSLIGWARHGDTLAFRRAWTERHHRGGPSRGGHEARTG